MSRIKSEEERMFAKAQSLLKERGILEIRPSYPLDPDVKAKLPKTKEDWKKFLDNVCTAFTLYMETGCDDSGELRAVFGGNPYQKKEHSYMVMTNKPTITLIIDELTSKQFVTTIKNEVSVNE